MKKHFYVMGFAALLMIVIALASAFSNKAPSSRLTQLQAVESPNKIPSSRLTQLQALELPPDGLELYRTLLQEIPEVVSQVPCACCDKMLSACYKGYCPPS